MAVPSRERMLAALTCQQADHVPCCFMIFNALRQKCADQFEFVERQLAMGLDAYVGLPVRSAQRNRLMSEQADLHGLPVRWGAGVEMKEWREDLPGERYPLLHREYTTPAGKLHTCVSKTEDWTHGDRVPLFDDFVIPRAKERLVKGLDDLPKLRHLLTPPADEDIAWLRETTPAAREFAAKHGVLTAGEWGVGWDALCWLCGIQELSLAAMDQPELVHALVEFIGDWNRQRMAVVLEAGVDLYIRRAWYEGADFLSPRLYRQFILPELEKDVQLAHQAGAKLAYIITTGYVPLLDLLLEAGIDAIIGLDPVQDHRADFRLTKEKVGDRICLWGGVNGFVTMERGTPEEVRKATREAIDVLAPGGGFILSPVDNVTEDTERVWANVDALIEEWRATW